MPFIRGQRATMLAWLGMLAALACVVLVSGLEAGTRGNKLPGGAENKGNGANKVAQGALTQQLVTELHTTKKLLENADHDYQGHRAHAVHHVGAAIHTLLGQKHTQTVVGANTAKNVQAGNVQGGKNPLPQAVSDAHLKKALQQLQIIHQQVTSTNGNHHAGAAGHIQNAIAELNTALMIK